MTLHGEKLRTDLRVLNTGDAPFSFTGALHSYFEVLDVGIARVKGLSGLTYLDKVTRFSAWWPYQHSGYWALPAHVSAPLASHS